MTSYREACGRCAMSTAVEVASGGDDGEDDEGPYGADRIEVEEDQLRTVSPGAWLAGVADRIGATVDRLTWGR
ncbi:hypothetical protein [Halopiger goleimassiliensis]|uniref:hypothetical protein n=1 Tax=Halopiger goleimassiliensis TaxID=1293048 RepID=UPI0006776C3E|nr:hypothetical protein [Halopiger goleimassiliensis]